MPFLSSGCLALYIFSLYDIAVALCFLTAIIIYTQDNHFLPILKDILKISEWYVAYHILYKTYTTPVLGIYKYFVPEKSSASIHFSCRCQVAAMPMLILKEWSTSDSRHSFVTARNIIFTIYNKSIIQWW